MFIQAGVLYRQVNQTYQETYEQLMQSGLYQRLTREGYLIPHEEVDDPDLRTRKAYKLLCPSRIEFISYPYEWCFSQFRDAALLTLDIQRLAVEHGMTLKDASAYNVQFQHGRPVFIDTLSFEKYVEGQPWVAYRQFCQHFLAPLALMAKKDIRLNKLMLGSIDGIPLDLASALLPGSTWFNPGLAIHLHIHAKTQKAFSDSADVEKSRKHKQRSVSKNGLLGIIDGLRRTVSRLSYKKSKTEWGDYYKDTNYSEAAFEEKMRAVKDFLKTARPGSVWDVGANTGVFSRLAREMDIHTVSFDIDPVAVEYNYKMLREKDERNLLPLLLDLTSPSPDIGWENSERDSLIRRGPVDCVLALALVHHLAISNNVPIERIASFFAKVCSFLIIEFVPKADSQVQRLLASREDIFDDYEQQCFEDAFSCFFELISVKQINQSERLLYLMKNKSIPCK